VPVLDIQQPLFAFGNVYCTNGIALGTPLVRVTPAALGAAKATDQPSLVLAEAGDDFAGWATSSPATDPLPPVPVPMLVITGPGGERALAATVRVPLQTRRPGDPKWRGPDGAALRLLVTARADCELAVRVVENDMAQGMATYEHKLKLNRSNSLQAVTLAMREFSPLRGEPLVSWRTIQLLEIETLTGRGGELGLIKAEWVP
jgi:hypothetical protein